ncbi:MAG: hypothetical protein ACRCTA_03680, partial [Bacilli bacterium]
FLRPSPILNFELPIGAQQLSDNPPLTNNNSVIVRYPKSQYPNSDEVIEITTFISGRYAAENFQSEIVNTRQSMSHEVGISVYPVENIGRMNFDTKPQTYSEDALKLGSVESNHIFNTTSQTTGTVAGDTLKVSEGPYFWLKDNIETKAAFSFTKIVLVYQAPSGTIPNPPSRVTKATLTLVLEDGSEEVIVSNKTISLGDNIYANNSYQSPTGKRVEQINVTIENPAVNSYIRNYSGGYISSYPQQGMDAIVKHYGGEVSGLVNGNLTIAQNSGFDKKINYPIVKDTKIAINLSANRTSESVVNPGGIDEISLNSYFHDLSKTTLLNPSYYILLPKGYAYSSYNNTASEFTTGDGLTTTTMPDGKLDQGVVDVFNNYLG